MIPLQVFIFIDNTKTPQVFIGPIREPCLSALVRILKQGNRMAGRIQQ